MPNDVVKLSVTLPIIKNEDDLWDCEIKVNKAILELKRHGGGPVHINLPTIYSLSFDVRELPKFRVINRITATSVFPDLPKGKKAIFIGAHAVMSREQTDVIDRFCASNDAVVFCDHTSGYKGVYRVLYSLAGCQEDFDFAETRPEVLIHIGEISGDYYTQNVMGKEVWRVNEDGEIRDTFRKLRYVFETSEQEFFEHYAKNDGLNSSDYLATCKHQLSELYKKIPELPFSNIWIASQMAHQLPESSIIHFGILNSLRSWNFFALPQSVNSSSNVGGFGIDGCISALIGASLANKERLFFGVMGDLAFFYDLNVLGNRHVGCNVRVLLVNNGKGTEFKNSDHIAAQFEAAADKYIAAAGHYGNKSPVLVKHYAQDLGFEYLSAGNKQEFEDVCKRFLTAKITTKPMLFEVFTDSRDESEALEMVRNVSGDVKRKVKRVAKTILKTMLGK